MSERIVSRNRGRVENVHARCRDLSVNEQGQLLLLHGGKRRIDASMRVTPACELVVAPAG